jgi:hypothetical protein
MAHRSRRAYRRAVDCVRLLFDRLPPMLRSLIVDALADRRDVTLVEREGRRARLGRDDVDVIVAAVAAPDDPQIALPLLWRWPRSRVVMIAQSGRHAVAYELVTRKLALPDVSRDTLVDAVCRTSPIEPD